MIKDLLECTGITMAIQVPLVIICLRSVSDNVWRISRTDGNTLKGVFEVKGLFYKVRRHRSTGESVLEKFRVGPKSVRINPEGVPE